jgi:hypothetical protein
MLDDRMDCLEYLAERVIESTEYTVQNDGDCAFTWILIRQRMLDVMQETDRKFHSALAYQYDPSPYQAPNGMITLAFTDQEDFEAGNIALYDLDPFPWESEEEDEEISEPAVSFDRRVVPGRKVRKR